MPLAGFGPAIPEIEPPRTYALDRIATGIDKFSNCPGSTNSQTVEQNFFLTYHKVKFRVLKTRLVIRYGELDGEGLHLHKVKPRQTKTQGEQTARTRTELKCLRITVWP
jgi:hypothetical protein